MFKEVLSRHEARRKQLRSDAEERKIIAKQVMQNFASSTLEKWNEDVSRVYENQEEIEKELKLFEEEAGRFADQTNKLIGVYEKFNSALLELGDVKDV